MHDKKSQFQVSMSLIVGEQGVTIHAIVCTVVHDTIGLMASQCIVPPHTRACISTHTHTLTDSIVFVFIPAVPKFTSSRVTDYILIQECVDRLSTSNLATISVGG